MMSLLRLVAAAIASLLLVGAIGLGVCYWVFVRGIAGDVERLATAAQPSGTLVTEAMLANLPAAAQRYFRHAGVLGKPMPRLVRLTQKGRIRGSSEAAWMTFEADETYSTSPPAFVWRAWFPSKSLPVALGRDEYLDGEGSIVMKMLSLVPLADEHGAELGLAGLMRYLNETMWFPAALLGPNVSITAIDEGSFRATLADRGMTAEAVFFIDAEGRLTNFRAPRFNTRTGTVEAWETPVGGYAQLNRLNLPTSGSAVWKLVGGDLTYIELTVESVVYE
jgi:hypothetical protein